MRHRAYRLLCRVPVGARLALGCLVAGLAAVLASGFVGLQSSQASDQARSLQQQLSAASANLTTALLLLEEEETSAHSAIEDAAAGLPRATLLSDQKTVTSLAAEYEAEIARFVHENLLSQQPAQAAWLNDAGQGDEIDRQHGLTLSVIYSWQRAHAAQTQALQDILAGKVSAAQTLMRAQANPLGTDALSAMNSLIQFENDLARSVQSAAAQQEAHHQRILTVLAAAAALIVILVVSLLITASLLGPLHQLRQVTQAAASGDREARVAVVGHDEIAAASANVNDLLAAIDGLLAEVNRQHQGIVSAAERLAFEANGEDANAVHMRLAEMGDPLGVLDAVCSNAITRLREASRLGKTS